MWIVAKARYQILHKMMGYNQAYQIVQIRSWLVWSIILLGDIWSGFILNLSTDKER